MARSLISGRRAAAALALTAASPVVFAPDGAFSPAWASDVLTVTLSERLEADSNIRLDSNRDAAVGSRTTVGVNYSFSTPRSAFGVGASGTLNLFTGDDFGDPNGINPSFGTSYGFRDDDTRVNFSLSGTIQPASFIEDVELIDDGEPIFNETEDERDTLAFNIRGGVTVSQSIDSDDSVSFSISGNRRDFLDSSTDLSPSSSIRFNTNWRHDATPRVDFGFGGGVSYFVSEGDDSRNSLSFSVTGNAGWRPIPGLSVNGSIGPRYTITNRENGEDTSSVGVRASAGFNYAIRSDTSISGALSQGLSPTGDDGALTNLFGVTVGLNHSINSVSRIGWRNSLTFRTAAEQDDEDDVDDRTTFSSGVSYSYQLTPQSSASLGYTFRLRDEEDSVTSHKVFLTFSRDFTFLP